MKLNQRIHIKTSVKRVLITTSTFCFLLAIGFIIFINLSDKREARAAANGDYRTKASGDWNNASIWEKYDGSAWVNATEVPTFTDGVIEIANGNYITISSDVTVDEFLIDDEGMLTNSAGSFTIKNGAGTDITVKGFWSINSLVSLGSSATGVISGYTFCQSDGRVSIASNASVTINNYGIFEKDGGIVTSTTGSWIVSNGGSYRHNEDGGMLPLATWLAGSNCEITGSVLAAPANLDQGFSNFAWSCASQAGNLNLNDALKTVNGDFRMTSTGTGSIKFSSSAINQSLNIRGSYYQDGGKIFLTETGNWNINIMGSLNVTAGSIIMTDGRASVGEGNPSISVMGDASVSGGLIDMSQYTLSVTGKGIGTINFYENLNHNGGTITATSSGSGYGLINFSKIGKQTFFGDASFGSKVDVSVKNGTILELGAKIITGGRNFTLATGGGLILGNADGITTTALKGNIQMPGMRTFQTGSNYTYCSTAAQVTGNAIPSLVNNFTVINSLGLTLSKSVVVSNILAMTSGTIHTLLDTLSLGFNNSSPGTLVRTTATVSGWFKRWISVNTVSDYPFPVSFGNRYRGVNIKYTSAPSTGGFVTIHYTPAEPGIAGLPLNDAGTTISDVGHEGYWNITAESRLNSGTCNIDIHADNYTGLTDYTKLHIVRRANMESAWTLAGTHSASTGSNNNSTTYRQSITGSVSGEYAIAGSKFNPKPVELLSFDAKPSGNVVKLSWVTANEINNDYFVVERSEDTINFLPIKNVDGAGNSSSILNYYTIDENPLTGINYYRLKQTDFDNNFTYSEIKKVRFGKNLPDENIAIESIWPNPFMENFTINYFTLNDGTVYLTLMNCWGEVFKKETLSAVKGINTYDFTENINLNVGMYYVRLVMNGKVATKKIIKNS